MWMHLWLYNSAVAPSSLSGFATLKNWLRLPHLKAGLQDVDGAHSIAHSGTAGEDASAPLIKRMTCTQERAPDFR